MREPTTEANNPIEQEFLSVIREYERVIYKVCYLYTHPNAPLNDLYQDVVLNLWKAYPKFRKECKISTWIYRIALNTCISFYRKEKNVPEIISQQNAIKRYLLSKYGDEDGACHFGRRSCEDIAAEILNQFENSTSCTVLEDGFGGARVVR